MERVKLTFEKGENGERVIIRKDGGFSTSDMARLTEVVEEMFQGIEPGEPDRPNEELAAAVSTDAGNEAASNSFIDRVNREALKATGRQGGNGKDQTTPPDGRGQVAAKLPDGTGVTKEGTVDRRTLRGTPEKPDQKQQQTAKKVQDASRRGGGGGEARR